MPQLYRQASKHIFFEEMHYKHLSLHPFIVMSLYRMIIPAAIDDFCNQFWETLKISLQSTKPFLWKQLPVSHFGQTPVCWMWESLQQLCAQYTSLKIVHSFTVKILTIWYCRQAWHFFITAVCQAECITYT